jgi:hypothetical protein
VDEMMKIYSCEEVEDPCGEFRVQFGNIALKSRILAENSDYKLTVGRITSKLKT